MPPAEAPDLGDAPGDRPVPAVWPRPTHVGNGKYLAGLAGALPVHSATYRAGDGALASSELRVPGRDYVFRDAERADDAR